MVMTFRPLAAGAPAAAKAFAEYLSERAQGEERAALSSYYARDGNPDEKPLVRADVHPALAAAMDLKAGEGIDGERLANVLQGLRADGEKREYASAAAEARHKVAGYDLCFSPHKSLSVAWALAPTEAERASLLAAHRTAVREALGYFEAEVGQGAHLAWITKDHYAARPTVDVVRPDPETGEVATERHRTDPGGAVRGDPQIHTHCVVLAATLGEDGAVRALDTWGMHGRIHEMGAVYHAVVARELRRMGVEAELDPRTLTCRLPAVPQRVCDHFSRRTVDGTEAARGMAAKAGLDWDAMPADDRVSFLKRGTQNGRLEKDTAGDDIPAWAADAAAIGYRHRSPFVRAPGRDRRPEAERAEAGWRRALPLLADRLDGDAVLHGHDVRLAAARALIASGLERVSDVSAVCAEMSRRGVRQAGRMTRLVWEPGEPVRARVTTLLHADQEREAVRLAKAAAADRSMALPVADLARHVHAQRLRFSREQSDAIRTLGCGGGLAVSIGIAGAGKTALLSPVVAAHEEKGRHVYGTALARRTADALHGAGIARERIHALTPFLAGLGDGTIVPARGSVVVVDELSQVGTRQMLSLLRAQERLGLKVVAIGDPKQARSIEAGPVMDLLREALGRRAIPEILTTVRQRTERERAIAFLFRGRDGDSQPQRLDAVARAIGMKREDGTAEMVPGGRREVVERVARLFMERREANRHDRDHSVTVSAPTNADAMEISGEIRERRRAAGEVGPDLTVLKAEDAAGNAYDLPLAAGDRVRLFRRTMASYPGSRNLAPIGNNGSVLTVRGVEDRGLLLETRRGKVGLVAWSSLRPHGGGSRFRLAYGDCLTIDTSQGLTSDEHIDAMPGGSAAVTGRKGYVAESRHRNTSWMVVSAGAELREVDARRPLGERPPAAWPDREAEAWANVARNLARQPVERTALSLMRSLARQAQEAAGAFREGLRRAEAREAAGLPRHSWRGREDAREVAQALPAVAARLEENAIRVRQAADALVTPEPGEACRPDPADGPAPSWAEGRAERRASVAARMVDEGALPWSEALHRLVAAEWRDGRAAFEAEHGPAPADPVARAERALRGPDPAAVEARAEMRLMAALDRLAGMGPEVPAHVAAAGEATGRSPGRGMER